MLRTVHIATTVHYYAICTIVEYVYSLILMCFERIPLAYSRKSPKWYCQAEIEECQIWYKSTLAL
jgi:hypothetical protein